MDLSKIRECDWEVFSKKFPDAYSFLTHRSLWNEYWDLKSMSKNHSESMNEWQWNRLDELEVWYENNSKIQKA